MNKIFFNMKFCIVHIGSSLISYIFIIVFGLLDVSVKLNITERTLDFCIVLFVFLISFIIYGIVEKNINYQQIVIVLFFNVICAVLLLLFDGSFINFLLIPLNSILVYGKDFFEGSVSVKTDVSIVISLLISCVLPILDLIILKCKQIKRKT